jgi:hypothetical protein
LPEDGRSDPDDGGPLLDRHFEIVTHTHR